MHRVKLKSKGWIGDPGAWIHTNWWIFWESSLRHVTSGFAWSLKVFESLGKMSWCLMSSDVNWHIRDKLWPMLKHGSINLHPRKPEGSLGRTSQDVHLDSHITPELWFGENGISFSRPWKSVKTEWCLWKFVNLWSSEKAREKLSAYQSETAFPKTKQ